MTASIEAEIARILVEDPYVGYVIMRERKCAVEYGSSCIALYPVEKDQRETKI